MDYIFNDGNGVQVSGEVGSRLLQVNFDANALRPYINNKGIPIVNIGGKAIRANAATLRRDEWKQFDEVVQQISRARLLGIADLESRGLTYNITNGLGTTVLEYEDISDMNAAEMDMDGETEGRNDRVQYSTKYLPLPITHKDFRLNIRQLNSSRTRGMALDTTHIETSTIKVIEKMESVLFNGSSTYSFGGGVVYGYCDFPNRVTGTLTAGWDDSAATGATMLKDLIAMKQALIDVKHYGPYVVYIPTAFETALDEEFKAASDKSIRQRLLEIEGIEAIKIADYLTADQVLMVEMQSSTVRIVNGLPIAPIQWEEKGGMVQRFKVMGIKVPQIRADQDGNCGVAHYSAP